MPPSILKHIFFLSLSIEIHLKQGRARWLFKFSHKWVYDQKTEKSKVLSTSPTVTNSSITDTLNNATVDPSSSHLKKYAVTCFLAKDQGLKKL